MREYLKWKNVPQLLKTGTSWVASFAVPIAAVCFIYWFLNATLVYDDTDDVGNEKRSGASLIIDYETGCHYLGKLFGGITPRMDKNGKHICRKKRNDNNSEGESN